jgi:hypothetical protein
MYGLKRFIVKYGEKEFPIKGGIEFQEVPVGKQTDYTEDEIKLLHQHNLHNYEMIRKVWAPKGELHKLELNAKDFFKYFFVMAVDLSPMGMDCIAPDTREQEHIGDIALELHFAEQLPPTEPLHLICIQDHKNTMSIQLPQFTVSTDY